MVALRTELHATVDGIRRAWREGGIRQFRLTLAAALVIAGVHAAHRTERLRPLVDRLAAVRQTEALTTILARTPLSLVAPAPRLPVWGAVLQVVIVVALAETFLGRVATTVVAVATQAAVNVVVHAAVLQGHASWFGITVHHLSDRDTGPSAAVVALALVVACEVRAWAIGGIFVAAMVVETLLLPDMAGHEHLLSIVIGGCTWVVLLAIRRFRNRPTPKQPGRPRPAVTVEASRS